MKYHDHDHNHIHIHNHNHIHIHIHICREYPPWPSKPAEASQPRPETPHIDSILLEFFKPVKASSHHVEICNAMQCNCPNASPKSPPQAGPFHLRHRHHHHQEIPCRKNPLIYTIKENPLSLTLHKVMYCMFYVSSCHPPSHKSQ